MKKKSMAKRMLSVLIACLLVMSFGTNVFAATIEDLQDGVTVLTEGATDVTYNVGEGKVLALVGSADKENPVIFKNCNFNLSGKTMSPGKVDGISYANGETYTKLLIGGNIQFDNCTIVSENGQRSKTSGNDACIYIGGSGDVVFHDTTISGTDYFGQFFALYYDANVTINGGEISTTGNRGGWSYAMYGSAILNLNGTTMRATGMQPGGSNVNAFYSGDLRTNYDAINITDSTIDFSDNNGGGFAINRVNIHVDGSKIMVNDNAGNATNSGVWYVTDSELTMSGNRTHGFSHIYSEMKDSTLTIEHNGYAGFYLQSGNASYQNCNVNIRCNGESSLSYSAGDVWLNGHTLSFKDCDSVWLGAVGRTGQVTSDNCDNFVAYDLYENKLKSNTSAVLSGIELDGQDEHVLFLNPELSFDYARGDTEGKDGNSNDDDLFADVAKEVVIGKDTAKIGSLTTAQLSHHEYDWANGEITDAATADTYGVVRYACKDACADYIGRTQEHTSGLDCRGVYVYAPLCGLAFDDNVDDNSVSNMPNAQDKIAYNTAAASPESDPVRAGYAFTGWYTDPACTQKADLSAALTANWTTVYAGWAEQTEISVMKVWDDQDNKDGIRPESVTVVLLADGQETAHTVTLRAENNWKGVFSGINKYDENGKEIAYTVSEEAVKGYMCQITGDAETGFVLTNQHVPEAEQPDTGDYANTTLLFTIVGVLLFAAAAGTVLLLVRRRESKE